MPWNNEVRMGQRAPGEGGAPLKGSTGWGRPRWSPGEGWWVGLARRGLSFTQSPHFCPNCAPRSGWVHVMAVLAWSHLSSCGETKVDVCPGSDIFFGEEGMMIYYQVTEFWTLAQICSPPGNITDRALLVSKKHPWAPLLHKWSWRGREGQGGPQLRIEPRAAFCWERSHVLPSGLRWHRPQTTTSWKEGRDGLDLDWTVSGAPERVTHCEPYRDGFWPHFPTFHGFSMTCPSSPSLLGFVIPITGDLGPMPGPRSYPDHLKFS